MRFVILCLLLINFFQISGQTFCKDIQSVDQYGDYPPGCTMCGPSIGSDNFGYTPDDTISYDFPCGEVENSAWYSFYSRAKGLASISLVVNESKLDKGIEVAIFDQNLNRISDCISIKKSETGIFELSLPALQFFQIMVDGIDGDECEYRIFTDLPTVVDGDEFVMNPRSEEYCVGAKVFFSRPQDYFFDDYEWQISADDSIVSGGLDEPEICIYFKTPGVKEISLAVSTPCRIQRYFRPLLVKEGQSLSIESFTSDTDVYCVGDEVEFEVEWENDTVGLLWETRISDFQKRAGGGLADNFYRGRVTRAGDLEMIVVPDHECGLRYEHRVTSGGDKTRGVEGVVCNRNCFVFGDSCYSSIGQPTYIIEAGLSEAGCDSTIFLSITTVDVFPSPNIVCEPMNDGIRIAWDMVSGADQYIIFSNRDSIATVSDSFFFLENSAITAPLVIKVQPNGECTYLPTEIDCSDLVKVNSNFLNNKIKVFPNPTTGHLNIETDLKIQEVNIYDATGRFLQKEKTGSLELINRTSGIYFLKIKTNEGVGVKRIIIN